MVLCSPQYLPNSQHSWLCVCCVRFARAYLGDFSITLVRAPRSSETDKPPRTPNLWMDGV